MLAVALLLGALRVNFQAFLSGIILIVIDHFKFFQPLLVCIVAFFDLLTNYCPVLPKKGIQ